MTELVKIVDSIRNSEPILGLLQARYTMQLAAVGTPAAALGPQAFLLAFQGTFQYAAALAVVAGVLLWSSRFTTAPS